MRTPPLVALLECRIHGERQSESCAPTQNTNIESETSQLFCEYSDGEYTKQLCPHALRTKRVLHFTFRVRRCTRTAYLGNTFRPDSPTPKVPGEHDRPFLCILTHVIRSYYGGGGRIISSNTPFCQQTRKVHPTLQNIYTIPFFVHVYPSMLTCIIFFVC